MSFKFDFCPGRKVTSSYGKQRIEVVILDPFMIDLPTNTQSAFLDLGQVHLLSGLQFFHLLHKEFVCALIQKIFIEYPLCSM